MSDTENHTHTDDAPHDHGMGHALPLSILIGVWAALTVLTVITVGASYIEWGGSLDIIIAMGIATVKAVLVALFFMHLKYDRKLYSVVFVAPLLFLALFLSLAVLDSRQYHPDIEKLEKDMFEAPETPGRP